jgi:RNA polymerase sigma-70 factor (ECF subfamily)
MKKSYFFIGGKDMDSGKGDVTQLLDEYRLGDRDAEAELFKRVYSELHRLAAHFLRGQRSNHVLQPTALVNEAYLRLVAQREKEWQNRAHFIAVSARIMRQVLVDFARHARAEKRDSGTPCQSIQDVEIIDPASHDPAAVLDLDAALTQLAEVDERQVRVVELRYFAGLSVDEVAAVLAISPRSVKREWTLAREWLLNEMTGGRQARLADRGHS